MDITKLRSDQVADKAGDTRVRNGGSAAKAGKVRKADDATAVAPTDNARDSVGVDQVKLSSDAHAVREGVELAKQAPDARAEKVAALKHQIKGGNYNVDSKAVAEKMIQASLEDDILARHE